MPMQCIPQSTPWQFLGYSNIQLSSVRISNFSFATRFSRDKSGHCARNGDSPYVSYCLNSKHANFVKEETETQALSGNFEKTKTQSGSRSSFSKIRKILNGSVMHDIVDSDKDIVIADEVKSRRRRKGSKESSHSPSKELRLQLDMCSKEGDFMRAIELFDFARKGRISLAQYQYTVLLYLCSSAAMGVVRAAKSGNTTRNVDMLEVGMNSFATNDRDLTENVGNDIKVSDEQRKYAVQRGFEIYEIMVSENVEMNEAALTSVARMAMSIGDGDLAFEMVKKMKQYGISTKLRSYFPALSAFCNSGNVEKAFAVEKHMLDNVVRPEEQELELLLKLSVEAANAEKVYYVLHKMRANGIKASSSTAELIIKWFESESSTIGKKKWNERLIKLEIENRGGGWHGQGWLGYGKWDISTSFVKPDAACSCCGENLAIIDLDPLETEKFADSVASIAYSSERDSTFEKFQKWLKEHGNFEAVVDGANVGLFQSRRFSPSKIGAIQNAVRQKLQSTRWALVVLHNKRLIGHRIEEDGNQALIEKWKNAEALYATPTGSNDDWYWLYAAIKCRSLIITNDEMRDHVFQLLGDDFFPKWKERHQVRFSFSDNGPVLHMPPPYSVVIQESENGSWHIPLASENVEEANRKWLCISRTSSNPTIENFYEDKNNVSKLIKSVEKKPKSEEVTYNVKDSSSKPPSQSFTKIKRILAISFLQDSPK